MTTSNLTTQNSPLNEAEENSLNELFARDPLELSTQDINIIVLNLRRQRVAWESEEASAKKTGKRPSASKAKAIAADISLGDLDLDL